MSLSKLSLALNLVLVVLIVILFSKVSKLEKLNQSQPTIASNVIDTAFNTSQKHTLVYINVDSLDANYQMVKDMRDELEKERQKSRASLETKYKALETEFIKAQEESKYYTQKQAQDKQAELMEKEQKLVKMEQDLTEKLQQKEIDKNKELQQLVHDALDKLKEKHQYNFVFGYTGWGNVLFAHDSLDITKDVLHLLNTEYAQQKSIK